MALIRWEPVGELNTIQNEMNRLFNTFFDESTPTGRAGGPGRRRIPAMDLVETGGHYVLQARVNARLSTPSIRRATTVSSALSAASPRSLTLLDGVDAERSGAD